MGTWRARGIVKKCITEKKKKDGRNEVVSKFKRESYKSYLIIIIIMAS